MSDPSNDLRRVRDAAIEALTSAFDAMDPETGRRVMAALDDPERMLTLAVWLPSPRVDICAVPVDGETPPELLYSRPCGH